MLLALAITACQAPSDLRAVSLQASPEASSSIGAAGGLAGTCKQGTRHRRRQRPAQISASSERDRAGDRCSSGSSSGRERCSGSGTPSTGERCRLMLDGAAPSCFIRCRNYRKLTNLAVQLHETLIRRCSKRHDLPAMNHHLVIGASGLVGRRLLHATRWIGTYHTHKIKNGIPFDLATGDPSDLFTQVSETVTHIIILAAISNIDACARDPAGTALVNVAATCRLADAAAERGIVPVFASSDAVYDGSHPDWREDDIARPILVYGRQKLEVERHLSRATYPSLVLRIAKVLDPNLSQAGVLGPWLADLRAGRHIRCATDQNFTPIGIDDLVRVISQLMEAGATGIFNIGGEPVSRISLLEKMIAAASSLAKIRANVVRCSLHDFPFAEKRPLDLRMSIAKLRAAIMFSPEPLEALCRRAANNLFAPPAQEDY